MSKIYLQILLMIAFFISINAQNGKQMQGLEISTMRNLNKKTIQTTTTSMATTTTTTSTTKKKSVATSCSK